MLSDIENIFRSVGMSLDKDKVKKIIGISSAVLGTMFVGLSIVAKIKRPSSIYDDAPEEKNLFEGKKVVFIKDDNIWK